MFDGNVYLVVALAAGSGIAAFLIGWFLSRSITKERLKASQQEAERIVADAHKEAETMYKEKMLELRAEQLKQQTALEDEMRNAKNEIARQERSIKDRDANLKNQRDEIEKKRKEVDRLLGQNTQKEKKLDEKESELDESLKRAQAELERAAGLSKDDALEQLKESLMTEAQNATAELIKNMRDEAKSTANREAREVIVSAIQRSAADHSVESTVSAVHIPNDEIKGRIIGREGRNIRAFEMTTGVDVIIDDTPEIVVLSSYNSFRREIAKTCLEKLITDGRIHPARIEEVFEKTSEEMRESLREIGEEALLDVGVHGVNSELTELIGKLRYRTAYGQNVLSHTLEVAQLCGIMAAELGLEVKSAKRAAMFHDIGKALDNYTEANHAQLGAELLKKNGEAERIVKAVASHHEDEELSDPIAVLVYAANQISGNRPGARRESLETFIKRMEELEHIAEGFDGVDKAFAIQSGREVRVMVGTLDVDDSHARNFAREIAKKIQDEMEIPGQVKVTVIREYRAFDVAT